MDGFLERLWNHAVADHKVPGHSLLSFPPSRQCVWAPRLVCERTPPVIHVHAVETNRYKTGKNKKCWLRFLCRKRYCERKNDKLQINKSKSRILIRVLLNDIRKQYTFICEIIILIMCAYITTAQKIAEENSTETSAKIHWNLESVPTGMVPINWHAHPNQLRNIISSALVCPM